MTSAEVPDDSKSAESSGDNKPTLKSIDDSAQTITPNEQSKEEADVLALRESIGEYELRLGSMQAEIERTKVGTDEIRRTGKLREEYAANVYKFMKYWIITVGILVLVDSFEKFDDCDRIEFDIETNVILAIVGGTTVAVIGLVLAVVKGLFPTYPNSETNKDNQ